MNHTGEFCTHTRDGDHVTKQLNSHHPAGARFVAAVTRTGAAGTRSYLDALRSVKVALPAELHIVPATPLAIRHRWIVGPSLLDIIRTDPRVVSAAVAQIAQWVEDLDGVDARIDTNLANFCLSDNQPVLVDVLPPLIPSLRPEPQNLFEEMFSALCFDTQIILDALIGYALRGILRTTDLSAARDLLRLARRLGKDGNDTGFPASWFRARRALAVRAAANEAKPEQVYDFFALTSVLRFRQLDEQARQLRLDEVARRIRELGV